MRDRRRRGGGEPRKAWHRMRKSERRAPASACACGAQRGEALPRPEEGRKAGRNAKGEEKIPSSDSKTKRFRTPERAENTRLQPPMDRVAPHRVRPLSSCRFLC